MAAVTCGLLAVRLAVRHRSEPRRWLVVASGIAAGAAMLAHPFGAVPATQVGLTLDCDFAPGKDFTVLAYVERPEAEQKVQLKLPHGLSLVKGVAEQTVQPPGNGTRALVAWTVRAELPGQYDITVQAGKVSHRRTVFITAPDPAKSPNVPKLFD